MPRSQIEKTPVDVMGIIRVAGFERTLSVFLELGLAVTLHIVIHLAERYELHVVGNPEDIFRGP